MRASPSSPPHSPRCRRSRYPALALILTPTPKGGRWGRFPTSPTPPPTLACMHSPALTLPAPTTPVPQPPPDHNHPPTTTMTPNILRCLDSQLNPSLAQDLSLNLNQIGDPGFEALFKEVGKGALKKLEKLNLGSNRVRSFRRHAAKQRPTPLSPGSGILDPVSPRPQRECPPCAVHPDVPSPLSSPPAPGPNPSPSPSPPPPPP